MALTMTRTRTQTTLTTLAEMLACVNGEPEFVRGLLLDEAAPRGALLSKQANLEGHRKSLTVTLVQFDPTLNPETIGVSPGWRAASRHRTEAGLRKWYLGRL